MRGLRLAVTVGCLYVPIATAGCGGGAEADYADAYNAVSAKVERQMAELNAAPTDDSKELSAQFGSLADTLGEAADEFATIDPPENAKAGHAKVQAGVEALAADLRKAAGELRGRSDASTGAVEALGAIANSKGPAQIEAGERELQRNGYGAR